MLPLALLPMRKQLEQGGEAVLGCEVVLYEDDDGGDLESKVLAGGVEGLRRRAEEDETACVEVDDDGEGGAGAGARVLGTEDSDPCLVGLVEGNVLGENGSREERFRIS
ncbi:hypothetical protein AAC387_Pa06g1233 [Persea americana]